MQQCKTYVKIKFYKDIHDMILSVCSKAFQEIKILKTLCIGKELRDAHPNSFHDVYLV